MSDGVLQLRIAVQGKTMVARRTIGNDYTNDDIAVYASCNYSASEGHVWVDIRRCALDSAYSKGVGIKLTTSEARVLAAKLMEAVDRELPELIIAIQSNDA